MNYYTEVLKKYAVFSGRARRKEYWMFTLWNCVITFALGILNVVLTLATNNSGIGLLVVLLLVAYGLAVIVPGLAVTVRRLHDTNHSGAWFFINLIPLIGPIISLVLVCTDSQPGDNQYGPNPKGVASTQAIITPPSTS
jgi:uncharacterized membrane protein YhaH (DUF805 family)